MEPGFHNTTRWREHELLFVTILFLAGVAGCIWPLFEHSQEQLLESWGRKFTDAHLSFNYYRNVLFPSIGRLTLLYICYYWMNFFIIPRFILRGGPAIGSLRVQIGARTGISMGGPAGIALRRAIWALINLFMLIVLLGIGMGIVYTYTHAPDIDSTYSGAMIVGIGLEKAVSWVIPYLIYAIIRELSIRHMQKDVLANASLISLINHASGFLLVYFGIGVVLYNFGVMEEQHLEIFYFTFLPPVLLCGLTNLYWVFPLSGDGGFWRRKVVGPLLISTFGWAIPFLLLMPDKHDIPPAIFAFGFVQLAVTTPLSWLIFRQRKDKIMQVRGLQTALGQSEADLQFLRSQINPHFLFNILNTLYGTALQEQAGKTAVGIQRLGDMMRFMLHENHLHTIPMNKEIDYLKNYIALQQLRTDSSESIVIETVIDEDFPPFLIAPMLFIPFVENGFKHGISLREPSWIRLRLHCEGKSILFEMRNSIHARKGDDPEKTQSGIGLRNVLHRLKLLYPDRHEFYMHQDEKEFFVQLSIQP